MPSVVWKFCKQTALQLFPAKNKILFGTGKKPMFSKVSRVTQKFASVPGGFKIEIISCKKSPKVGKLKATDSASHLLEECEITPQKWENRRAGRRMFSGKQNHGKQISQNPNQEELKQKYRTP